MIPGPLSALAERWRDDARLLRRHGAESQAEVVETHATELDEAVTEWWNEPLTLRQAEEESQLAYSTLQQYLAQGVLPNAGAKGKPRIRRRDLPRRGTRVSGPDIAQKILLRRL